MTQATHLDLLKFAVAVGAGQAAYTQGVMAKMRELGMLEWATLTTILESVERQLLECLPNGEADLDGRYSAGHRVASVVEFPDCQCTHVQLWHPDPRHSRNQAQVLADLPCPKTAVTHRIEVMEPGVLKTVDLGAAGAG
ncbi:hypothetical protein [Mycolicibacterium sp. lyk4-40-TYG-92]|uniref:hypothetical protein n=1 Tax=Mycolicibacterium sp. lyk4-40-TYG-92 TaxID=3040295 RepID=UPI00254C23D4|nr:hypothetical protein [Mycolicibacterium sp. lyk4-40-TYG-92]